MPIFDNKEKGLKGKRVYLRKKSHKLQGYFVVSMVFLAAYSVYSLTTSDKQDISIDTLSAIKLKIN